jgi:hypothetical protein
MYRTVNQAKASRHNGAKSKGPVSPEGKANSSRNATTHGLFSSAILLESESEAEWRQLEKDLIARFQPADNVELNLINEMAIASWRARRASALETALLSTEVEELADLTGLETDSNGVLLSAFGYANAVGRNKAVVELARQAERLNRLWMRLHTKLKELQKDRKAAEKQAAASAGQGAAGKRKNEPEGAEPQSDQRVGAVGGRPAGPVEPPLPPEEPVAGQPLAA